MRRYKSRAVAGALCAVLAVSACTGCTNGLSKETEAGKVTSEEKSNSTESKKRTIDKNTLQSEKIMTSFGEDIYLNEIFLYALDVMENSSTQPANGSALTDEEASALKKEIESETIRYKIEYHIALDRGYTLTDSDQKGVETLIGNFKNKYSDAFLQKLCIDDSLIEKVYTERAYVLKMEQEEKNKVGKAALASETDANSDMNFVSMYYMVFPTVASGTDGQPAKDDNGNLIPLSEDESKNVRTKADALVEEVRTQGKNPEDLVESYGVKGSSQEMSGYVGAYNDKVNDAIKDLKAGEITDPIESDLGYIVIYMKQDHDESLMKIYVEKLASDHVDQAFAKLKDGWVSDPAYADKVTVDGSWWEDFDLRQLVDYMSH